jgi:hypothetical protein
MFPVTLARIQTKSLHNLFHNINWNALQWMHLLWTLNFHSFQVAFYEMSVFKKHGFSTVAVWIKDSTLHSLLSKPSFGWNWWGMYPSSQKWHRTYFKLYIITRRWLIYLRIKWFAIKEKDLGVECFITKPHIRRYKKSWQYDAQLYMVINIR